MATSQPKRTTFLIVPGSFSTPPAYAVLVSHLQAKGYPARVIALLSANDGTRQPPAKGEDDAAHIRREILSVLDGDGSSDDDDDDNNNKKEDDDSSSDVVLAMHSYGGMPGTLAVQGLSRADRSAAGKSTAVKGLVYIASLMAPLGQASRDILASVPGIPEEVKAGVPGGYLPPLEAPVMTAIFNDMADPQAEVARYHGTFTQHSSDALAFRTRYEAWLDIPTVVLIPGNDIIVPTALQLDMYATAADKGGKVTKVLVEGAGHALNVSQPELVTAEMVKLADAKH